MTKAKRETNYWTDTAIYKLPPRDDVAKDADGVPVDHVVPHPLRHRFGVRFRGGKPVSYVQVYVHGGRERKRTIGKVKRITLTDALKLADKDAGLKASGKDPAIEHAKQKAGRDVRFKDGIEDHLAVLRSKKRAAAYVDDIERTLNRCKDLHGMSVRDLQYERSLISKELDKINDDHGVHARDRARAHLSG